MSLEQLTPSDEQVQDIVASLIASGDNADAVYDDVNDTLTISLSESVSVNTLEATAEPGNPTFTTLSDVASNLPESGQVCVRDENSIYVEGGT